MEIQFDPEESGVAKADKVISWLLKRYQLEFRADVDCEMWLEPIEKPEPPKPDLKIV